MTIHLIYIIDYDYNNYKDSNILIVGAYTTEEKAHKVFKKLIRIKKMCDKQIIKKRFSRVQYEKLNIDQYDECYEYLNINKQIFGDYK